MAASISADGLLLPLHVSEEDSLVEGETETEMGHDDVALILAIREREQSGEHASANWLRSALGAIRSTKRANRYLEEALASDANGNGSNGADENHGKNGNGSNGNRNR